jgi:hypothetical protein
MLCLLISVATGGALCEFYGDEWEQQVRSDLYKLIDKKIPAFSEEFIDSSGVPYVMYYELNGVDPGKQYNATIVCNYAIQYYNQLSEGKLEFKKPFLNCLTWLQQNIDYKNNAALYVFNWQQPWYDSVGVPFTSGMTNGLAIQVFTNGYQLTKDSTYLHLAKALVRGFYIPIKEGGFSYHINNGWWYEEIADTNMHTPFILDGHIFALTGVHHLSRVTKSDSAAVVFQKGITALKHLLPAYDKGDNWAYYDKYRKTADKYYQRILAAQMKQLWEITGDNTFLEYHNKWRKPFNRLYILRVAEERNFSGMLLILLMALPFITLSVILVRKRFI